MDRSREGERKIDKGRGARDSGDGEEGGGERKVVKKKCRKSK